MKITDKQKKALKKVITDNCLSSDCNSKEECKNCEPRDLLLNEIVKVLES